MSARWVKVKKLWRCHDCGSMVEITWQWITDPGTCTLALCEDCTEKRLADAA